MLGLLLLVFLVSGEPDLGSSSLLVGLVIKVIEECGNVGSSLLIDSCFDGCLSGSVGSAPGTVGCLECGDSALCVRDGLLGIATVGDSLGDGSVRCGSTGWLGGDEAGPVRLLVGLHGPPDLIHVQCLCLGGSKHQWDCDVLKHFAM